MNPTSPNSGPMEVYSVPTNPYVVLLQCLQLWHLIFHGHGILVAGYLDSSIQETSIMTPTTIPNARIDYWVTTISWVFHVQLRGFGASNLTHGLHGQRLDFQELPSACRCGVAWICPTLWRHDVGAVRGLCFGMMIFVDHWVKYDLGELVSHFQLSIPHFCLFRPSMCSLFVSYIRFARCSLYISSLVLHCSPHVHLCISELWPVFKRFWRVFRNILCIYIYTYTHHNV